MAELAYREKLISNGIARAKALLQDRNRLLVAVGWQLSPFTEYNDPVVNIPLAWLLARLLKTVLGWNLKQTFVPCYWFTNGLGILLLVVGLTRSGLKLVIRREEIVRLVLVTAAFSLLLFLISRLF